MTWWGDGAEWKVIGQRARGRAREGAEREAWAPLVVPGHALLVVEERLREHMRQGVPVPHEVDIRDLAVRVLLSGHAVERRSRDAAPPP